jgi:alginate O-acetyltransferase complex protein AlgI
LNYADISRANRAVLPPWLLAYGIKIYVDFSAYPDIAIGSLKDVIGYGIGKLDRYGDHV